MEDQKPRRPSSPTVLAPVLAPRRRARCRLLRPLPPVHLVCRHPCSAWVRPSGRPRRRLRGGRVHDERRAAAQRLVHPIEEPGCRDCFPGSKGAATPGAPARAPRLRGAPVRSPRRGPERRRPERVRLERRARRARRRRVPPEPCRRRPGADRRHRPLRRRRDDARGGGGVDRPRVLSSRKERGSARFARRSRSRGQGSYSNPPWPMRS